MRGLRVRITCVAPLKPEMLAALEQIPGICTMKPPYLPTDAEIPPRPDPGAFVLGLSVDLPIDALSAALVYLNAWGTQYSQCVYTRSGIDLPTALVPIDDLPSLTPEVKASMYPYQREGYNFFVPRGGGLAHWECGAGKTRMGLLFADSDPGRAPRKRANGSAPPAWPKRRVVIVTLPTTCYQWASAIDAMTLPGTMKWFILENESPLKIRPAAAPAPRVKLTVSREEARRRWMEHFPRSVKSYQVGPRTGLAPTGKLFLPEEGETVAKKAVPTLEPYVRIWPVLSEDVEDALDRLAGEGVEASEVPAAVLRQARSVGVVEEVPSPWEYRYEALRRRGSSVVQRFTGRELLFIQGRELSAILAGLQGMETSDENRRRFRVLSMSANGESVESVIARTGEDQDFVLDVRAKALAERWVQMMKGTCDLPEDVEVCILSWSLLPSRREFLRDWQPTTVILDESQNAKSNSIWTMETGYGKDTWVYNNSVAASTHFLTDSLPNPRVLLLTANPAPNTVPDWWSQLQLLTKGAGRYRTFCDRYADGGEVQINEHLTVYKADGVSHPEELDQRTAWWVHRVSKTELDKVLPPLTRDVMNIPPEELAKIVIPQAEWRAAKARGATGMQEMHVIHAAASKRPFIVKRALEHLEAGLKVVIFSSRILDCDRTFEEIMAALEKRKQKIDAWCVHGENVPPNKGQYIRHLAGDIWLNHPGPCLLVGTEDIWGTGIDGLQTTHKALRASLPITPLEFEQVEGRFDRPIPQHLPQISTNIEYFRAIGTIDDRILELWQNKMHAVGQTYGKFRERMKNDVASFQGHQSAEEAMEKIAERLTAGLPTSMFESFEEDE